MRNETANKTYAGTNYRLCYDDAHGQLRIWDFKDEAKANALADIYRARAEKQRQESALVIEYTNIRVIKID